MLADLMATADTVELLRVLGSLVGLAIQSRIVWLAWRDRRHRQASGENGVLGTQADVSLIGEAVLWLCQLAFLLAGVAGSLIAGAGVERPATVLWLVRVPLLGAELLVTVSALVVWYGRHAVERAWLESRQRPVDPETGVPRERRERGAL